MTILHVKYKILQRGILVLLFIIVIVTYVNTKQYFLLEKHQGCNYCPESAPCCSQQGICGSTIEHCGIGCQSGPCVDMEIRDDDNENNKYIITEANFQCAFPLLDPELLARRFQGLNETKWLPKNKDEAAIFLSHVAHETDSLKTYVEYCQITKNCDNYNTSWCSIQGKADKQYYGRGWLQLSYPCNYWSAGQALGIDLLSNPDLVAQSDQIAAATALWYYQTTNMHIPASRGDFAGTTRILNNYECRGRPGQALQVGRVMTYQRIRQCFGLGEGIKNLYC